jgi:predicted ArsR family transcriptional regulator
MMLVNRLYEAVKETIESQNGQATISIGELSEKLGTSLVNITYHMQKLVDQGKLMIIGKETETNKKIYKLG